MEHSSKAVSGATPLPKEGACSLWTFPLVQWTLSRLWTEFSHFEIYKYSHSIYSVITLNYELLSDSKKMIVAHHPRGRLQSHKNPTSDPGCAVCVLGPPPKMDYRARGFSRHLFSRHLLLTTIESTLKNPGGKCEPNSSDALRNIFFLLVGASGSSPGLLVGREAAV